jgi:tagaturonate epimerase
MSDPILLPKYTFGVGDRFAHQAEAQLKACMMASEAGVDVIPVWNKSNREHTIIGSEPMSVRHAADAAVCKLGWHKPYFCDADHINFETVDRFIEACDFYTIDVADLIGRGPISKESPGKPADATAFVAKHLELLGELKIPGIDHHLHTTKEFVSQVASKYLTAVTEAGRIFRTIDAAKGAGNFVTEVSMDETDYPQTPVELLIILVAIADEKIPIQTIAPKFTGRFNKGVDYVGDVSKFKEEFSDDIAAIAFAVANYGLPESLKLSVHSGSDKFSIYEPIREMLQKFGAGVHLKTAGTNWLEELIGLAEGGGEGLVMAKEIYSEAYDHEAELCKPYAAVIDIDSAKLPSPETVNGWSSEQYVNALRHDQSCAEFNPSLRQLLHVGFKIAAKKGNSYLDLLDEYRVEVSRNVTTNLFERHIKPLFL